MPEELCQVSPKSHYVSLALHSDPSPYDWEAIKILNCSFTRTYNSKLPIQIEGSMTQLYYNTIGLWSDGCYFPIWSETISDNLKSKPTWVTPQAGPMIEHLQKSVISVIEDWQHGARRQISCRAQGLTSKKLLSPGSDQRELVAYNSQGLSGHAAVQDQGHIGQQPHL